MFKVTGYGNHSQRKIVVSSENRTPTFGFLDRRSGHSEMIEPTGIGGGFIPFKCMKYPRHDLALVMDD